MWNVSGHGGGDDVRVEQTAEGSSRMLEGDGRAAGVRGRPRGASDDALPVGSRAATARRRGSDPAEFLPTREFDSKQKFQRMTRALAVGDEEWEDDDVFEDDEEEEDDDDEFFADDDDEVEDEEDEFDDAEEEAGDE